ncbi:MAG: DUF2085 domain-containing protein [Candidatus Micrarchaeota archaeon]
MALPSSPVYYLVVGFFLILNLSILAPPFLIFAGFEEAGAFLYNVHSYDHQWIYRSQCVFKDASGSLGIEDCIVRGREAEANISTLYTGDGDPRYNGIFAEYKQDQIGRNKAERVVRNGMTGYKFANDTRDYAIYIPWMLTMMAYPIVFGLKQTKVPHVLWLVLGLLPLAIDGTTQMLAGIFDNPSFYWLNPFGLQESTNTIRWITGAIAGIAAGMFTVPMLNALESGGGGNGSQKAS